MAKLIAHRGLSSQAHENTIKAFELAGQQPSVWGIETDIWLSKDSIFVCSHNPNPFVEPNHNLNVNEANYGEYKIYQLDTNETKYKIPGKAHICTFEDYLKICKQYNKVPVVEIKQKGFDISQIRQVIELVEKHELLNVVTFINFDRWCLEHEYQN